MSDSPPADLDVPDLDVALPEISQVGFVVEDLEDAMDRFGALLGIEPWLLYRYEPPRLSDTTYRGEPHEYSMRVALSDVEGPVDVGSDLVGASTLERLLGWVTDLRNRVGLGDSDASADDRPGEDSPLPNPGMPGLNVELIEPLEGPSLYTEHLEAHGEGLHHLGCFAFDDPYEVVERYEGAGIPVAQSGTFDGLQFWYLDATDEANGLLLETAANLTAVPEPDDVYEP